MKKVIFFLMCIYLSSNLIADISKVSATDLKTRVPVNQKVPIYYIDLTTTSDDITLESFTVEAAGQFSLNGGAFKTIEIYQDGPANPVGGDGLFNSVDDTLINTATFSSIDTGVPLTIAVNSQVITSSNNTSGYGYFIVVELDSENLSLGETTFFSVNEIRASDQSTLDNPDSFEFTATGLDTTYITNIAPDFVFPGQEEVPFLYFITEAGGETMNSLSLTLSDTFDNFVDSDDKNGVVQAELYVSKKNKADFETEFVFSTDELTSTLIETLTYQSIDWDAENSKITFNDNFPDLTPAVGVEDKEAFWVVYDIGENISVTSSTQINLTVDSLSALGDSSNLTIESTTTNISVSVPVAGVVVEDPENLVTDDVFGPQTFSPMISFKLRSYLTESIVNQINIINNGSIKFYADQETQKLGENVVSVELYHDTDNNESFSIISDTLVGKLICNNQSTNTLTKAPVTTNITVSSYDSTRDYPDNNEEMIFVLYRFGSEIDDTNDVSGNYSTAEIGNIFVSGNYTISGVTNTVLFKGSNSTDTNSLSSDPTANVSFSDTNISLSDIRDITPTTVYEGQEKVPMLYIELDVNTTVQTASFEINNSLGNFYGNSDGITKVWIYRDANDNKVFDSDDTFVTSTSSFDNSSTQVVSVGNIQTIQGVNGFLLLYDLGSNMLGEDAAAQLNTISVSGGSAIIGGVFPSPDSAALIRDVQQKPLDQFTIDNTTVSDATSTFNLTLSIQNNSGKTISVLDYAPKFYLNDIGGLDISYEFTILPISNTTFSLNNGASNSVGFQVSHSSPVSDGAAVVDGYIRYTGDGDSDSIIYQRFLDNNDLWQSAVSDTLSFAIETEVFIDGVLPAYVKEPLYVQRSNTNLTFLSGSAVESGDVMIVNFEDASGIDEGSISVLRGTDTLSQSPSLESQQKYFTFDKSNNQLTFYVGEQSESVILNMDDLFGNPLPTATFKYSISTVVELENPLFYPNPYVLGGNNLKLGFSISQPSTVKFYIYDFTGNEVFNRTQYFSNIGFNNLTISESESFVAPGIFICRIIATDNDGNESVQTAKLAIY